MLGWLERETEKGAWGPDGAVGLGVGLRRGRSVSVKWMVVQTTSIIPIQSSWRFVGPTSGPADIQLELTTDVC